MSKLSQAWRGRSAFEQFFVDVYDSLSSLKPSFKRQSSNSNLVNKIKQKKNINIRKAGDELEDVLDLDQILTDETLLSTLNSKEIEKLKKIIEESKKKIQGRKSNKEFSQRNNLERIERLRREIDKDFIKRMEHRLEKLGAQKKKASRLHMEKNELMEKMRLDYFGTTDLTQKFIDGLGERDRLMAEMMGAVELERLNEAEKKKALKEREEYIYKLMKKLGINTVDNRRRAREARESKSRGSRTSRKGFGKRKRKGSTKQKKKSMKKKKK